MRVRAARARVYIDVRATCRRKTRVRVAGMESTNYILHIDGSIQQTHERFGSE